MHSTLELVHLCLLNQAPPVVGSPAMVKYLAEQASTGAVVAAAATFANMTWATSATGLAYTVAAAAAAIVAFASMP